MPTAQDAACYVCGLPIVSSDELQLTSLVGGQAAYRHKTTCAPGTPLWAQKYPDSLSSLLSRKRDQDVEPQRTSPQTPHTAFNEFLDGRYWPVVKAKVSPRWATYTERYLLPAIRQTVPHLPMTTWDEEHLDQWWARIQALCTPSRANKVLTRFKHLTKTAKRWKVIPDNPSVHLRKIQEPEREYPSLSEHNQTQLLTRCRRSLRQYIQFALYTGGRRSSLAKLEHKDIDLAQGEILFRKTKNGKDYRVPIHPALWNVLGERLCRPVQSRNEITTCLQCLNRGLQECQHVLYQYTGLNAISRAFARLATRCGIPGFRFHDLRHCVGSRLAEAGANQKVIMEVLGHKTNVMSLRYTHVQRKAVRDAMEEHL